MDIPKHQRPEFKALSFATVFKERLIKRATVFTHFLNKNDHFYKLLFL
jgi:hypothetical protein